MLDLAQNGFGMALIDTPPGKEMDVAQHLNAALGDFSVSVDTTSDRLRMYQEVQNTYLETFQALGALGLAPRLASAEVAFTPTAADMYPDGKRTSVHPGPLGVELEGAARPTHFEGVLTVVLKLLQIVRPDRAFFGEKDYQQLVLVRQMVADLNVDTQIVGVPIEREADGLALSSRNRYLDEVEREQAGALSASLLAGMYAASGGTAAALDAAGAVLDEVPAIDVDYLEVRDAMLGPAPAEGLARMLVAARLGSTRLLDNIAIDIGATAGTDGYPRVGSNENHELPWRN